MAMKSQTIQFVNANGLDQRYKGELGYADKIYNFRIDPNGLGWVADRGIEHWWKFPNPFGLVGNVTTITENLLYQTDACYIWEKSSTGQIYYFYERAGKLLYAWGNKGQGSGYSGNYYYNDLVYLQTGRKTPKTNEVGTQFIPYGNRLLIINGYDKPIWFSGNEDFRDFSFSLPTASPQPTSVQPSYVGGSKLEGGTGAPYFNEKATLGLGIADKDISNYFWFMTYITEDGAESPQSTPVGESWEPLQDDEKFRFGVVLQLPQGPEGTTARRLYRTKNIRRVGLADANDSNYFFIKEFEDNSTTHFIDTTPDDALVSPAPTTFASTTINTTYKFGATWDNRIWLAGGDSTPSRIIYSEKGNPEQFGSFNFFEVGSTGGGHITQIYPYYNNLLVFRRNSIEIIRRDGTGSPTISTLSNNLGTIASNAICNVANLGVMFLNEEGIFLIQGGLDGGSQITITRVSETLDKELQKINKVALGNAWACYSPTEREAWFHFAVDSNSTPTLGLVYHLDNGAWSIRGSENGANENLFRFTCASTDPEGHFVFGTAPLWSAQVGSGSPVVPTSFGASVGPLVVWSGHRNYGQALITTSFNGDTATYSVAPVNRPPSVWESNWVDFGDNSKKHRVYSVEAEILSYGDLTLKLDYGTDYDVDFTSAGSQKMTKNERAFTTKEDPVFGPALPSVTKVPFTIATDRLKDARIIRLRWDCNTQLINQFKFRLETSPAAQSELANVPFHLLSFHINYDTANIQTLNQNTRLQKGQSR